jgi:hypothetical protein
VRDALACDQGRLKVDREVELQPSGSLCTVRRCTAGLAQGCQAVPAREGPKGSLNSSRSLRGFRARRHLYR